MCNIYTCTASGVNLITAIVLITDHQLIELTSDMIRGVGVDVPVSISTLGLHHHG